MCPWLAPSQQPCGGATAPHSGHGRKGQHLSPGNAAVPQSARAWPRWAVKAGWLGKQRCCIHRGTEGTGWRNEHAEHTTPAKIRVFLTAGWGGPHCTKRVNRPTWGAQERPRGDLTSRQGSATSKALAKRLLSSALYVPICERGDNPRALLEDWIEGQGTEVASSPDSAIWGWMNVDESPDPKHQPLHTQNGPDARASFLGHHFPKPDPQRIQKAMW